VTDKIKTWAARITKISIAATTAAVATYAAVRPEEVARRAITRIEVSHQEMTTKVAEIQKWSRHNRSRSKYAVESCKAEVSALTSFVTGYLMGLSKSTSGRRSPIKVAPASIKSLVDTLGKQKIKSSKAEDSLPKLAPPSPVQQILDRKKK